MNPTIIYVHGAGATPRSFAFIQAMLPNHEIVPFAYDTSKPSAIAITALAELANAQDLPVSIVAHSLGGLVSVNAAHLTSNIDRVFSIASPFGGSKAAHYLRWLFNSTLLDDLNPYSALVRNTIGRALPCPVRAVVTDAGALPFMSEPNDGVVTVASQTSLPGADIHLVHTNHFEALLSEEVVAKIKTFIFE